MGNLRENLTGNHGKSTFVHVEISCMSSKKKTSTFFFVLPNQWRFWSIPMDHATQWLKLIYPLVI